MGRIFISYRREDSQAATGRIWDRLAAAVGRDTIFRDIDAIPFGVDFREHVDQALDDCILVLAIIGDRWLTAEDETGHIRLENPADFVRIELERALARDINVIPVLLDHTPMPKATELPESLVNFAYRNAAEIDTGRRFDPDMKTLINAVKRILDARAKEEAAERARIEKEKQDAEREERRKAKEAAAEHARIEKEKREAEREERRRAKAAAAERARLAKQNREAQRKAELEKARQAAEAQRARIENEKQNAAGKAEQGRPESADAVQHQEDAAKEGAKEAAGASASTAATGTGGGGSPPASSTTDAGGQANQDKSSRNLVLLLLGGVLAAVIIAVVVEFSGGDSGESNTSSNTNTVSPRYCCVLPDRRRGWATRSACRRLSGRVVSASVCRR